MSTRPIGTFPNNIHSINDLISQTDNTLNIMTDVAGYGKFSAPSQCDQYLQNLRSLRQRGGTVTMIVYDHELQRKSSAAQFAPDRFPELTTSAKFHNYFSAYHPELESSAPQSAEQFFDFLSNLETQHRASLLEAGIKPRLLKELGDLPFFLWLRDDEEAIFSLFYMGEIVTDVAFQTSEASLVTVMRQIFDQVSNKAF